MHTRFILFTFLTLLVSSGYAQNYFEGEIYYQIVYDSSSNKLSKNSLIQEMGDSLTAYIKPDKFVLKHNTKGKYGRKRTIFLLAEGFSYIEYEKYDTILKFDLKKKSGELVSFEHNRDERKFVLNQLCESITIEFKSTDKDDYFQKKTGKYYFSSEKYKLNPEFYKNYRSNFWNLYVEKSGSISLWNEIEYFPIFKSTQQAYAIINTKVPDSLFEINTGKYIKLIN